MERYETSPVPARWKGTRQGEFYSLSLRTPVLVTAVVVKKERTDWEKSNQNINDAILGGFDVSQSFSSFTTPTISHYIFFRYLTEDSVRFIDDSFLHSAAVDAEMLLLGTSGVFTTG
jgi:hypothetical protein